MVYPYRVGLPCTGDCDMGDCDMGDCDMGTLLLDRWGCGLLALSAQRTYTNHNQGQGNQR